jgi:hypothetical protein
MTLMNFHIARLDFETTEESRHIAVYFKDPELCDFWITYHPEITDDGITVKTINASVVFGWSDWEGSTGWTPDSETEDKLIKCIKIGLEFIDFLKGVTEP